MRRRQSVKVKKMVMYVKRIFSQNIKNGGSIYELLVYRNCFGDWF